MVTIIKNGNIRTRDALEHGESVAFRCYDCGCVFDTNIYMFKAYGKAQLRETTCPQCLAPVRKMDYID